MSWFQKVILWFRALLRRERLENEMSKELRFHLDQQIENNVKAGMTPKEARYAALRSFGGVEQIKEECRRTRRIRFVDEFRQDIRYGARMMIRSPGFTIVTLLSLALGIGANTAIFSLIDAVLLKNLPVAEPERLYVLQPAGRKGMGAFSYPGFEVLRAQNQVFSDTFPLGGGDRWNVIVSGQAELTNGELVTGNYFSALGVGAIAGRTISASDDKESATPVAVISHSYWKKRFALDASAIASSITINGAPFTIVGVAPKEFFGVAIGDAPEIWVPFSMLPRISPGATLADSGTWWLSAMARLKPGVSEQQAQANLEVVLPMVQRRMEIPESRGQDHFSRIQLTPGGKGISMLRQQFSLPLRILMIVVGIVLLIACANVANLLLSRASARQREFAIRLGVGGTRSRLVRQLLTESILLAMIGGALGLLFALWSGNLLVAFLAGGRFQVNFVLGPDLRMLAFTGTVSLLTGILFGVAPALRATSLDPGPALKENVRSASGTRQPLSRVLIVLQVALSLLLLTGAGLFVRTLQNLRSRDLGFHPENVLLMTIEPVLAGYRDSRLTALYEQVLERIQVIPGVRSASLSRFGLIGAGYSGRRVSVPGYTPQDNTDLNVGFNVISPKFFETAGISLLAGREIGSGDIGSAPRVAIVNNKFARFYFGGENPIGRRFGLMPKEQFEIVGVVEDAKYFQLRNDSPRMVFVGFLQSAAPRLDRMFVAVRTAIDPASMAGTIRREIQSIAKDVPIHSVRTQEQQIDAALVRERLLATLSGFFSLLALLLACVGLYGVMSYTVAQRTREIGVRIALGAQRHEVLWLVLRQSLKLVAIGLVIGVPAALASGHLISSQLYGLSANDAAMIMLAVSILSAVAIVASYLPARRASRVDPMVALRYE